MSETPRPAAPYRWPVAPKPSFADWTPKTPAPAAPRRPAPPRPTRQTPPTRRA